MKYENCMILSIQVWDLGKYYISHGADNSRGFDTVFEVFENKYIDSYNLFWPVNLLNGFESDPSFRIPSVVSAILYPSH